MSAHCCVCVCFCCQLGGEEDRVWPNPVLEPHHTHHAVGEADQVSAHYSPQRVKPRPLNSNGSRHVGDLVSDLFASTKWGTLFNVKPERAPEKRPGYQRLQTTLLNDVQEPGKSKG